MRHVQCPVLSLKPAGRLPTTATATAATATRTITQVRVVYKDGSPPPDVALDTDSQNATTGDGYRLYTPQNAPPFYGLQIGGVSWNPYASFWACQRGVDAFGAGWPWPRLGRWLDLQVVSW